MRERLEQVALGAEVPPQPQPRLRVDLTNCDREPIHTPGAIQPHGCLLVCRLPLWTVEHASANLAAHLPLSARDAIGRPLGELLPTKFIHDIRNTLQTALASGSAERIADVEIAVGRFDAAVHGLGDDRAIIELVPREGTTGVAADPITLVKGMVGRLKRAPDLERFLKIAAAQVRAVTGFDRVMIYRFLHDGSGEVVAEALRAGVEPYLGLRYPASDIPAQARALYKRQWLRLIPDVAYAPVPVAPEHDAGGAPVDLGLASLRSVSPIHIEYLENMGVAATLTISIMRGDELWGLIACHHYAPRRLRAETLAACELFGQIFSVQVEAKAAQIDAAYLAAARATHDRLMSDMSPEDTIFDNLAAFAPTLTDLVPCDGVGVWTEGRFTGYGVTPPDDAVPALVAVLSTARPDAVVAIDALAEQLPGAEAWAGRTAGVLAVGFSRRPRDYLMFFRRELVQTVTWGGDPTKPVEALGPDSARLTPRKSFEAWVEEVRGRSAPWTDAEIRVVDTLRMALLEVILRRSDLLASERRAAQESQALLVAELNHRVKNILALIRSLVRQSRQGATSVAGFTADLEARVRSLALAHDQLTQLGWQAAPLRKLLEAEAQAWAPGGGRGRIMLSGPPVMLEARAFQALALVFHELMTNAAKYGALSRPAGRVAVEWSVDGEGRLAIDWRESGGPAVQAPKRRGFGSIVIERTVPFELKGETRVEYDLEGVRVRLTIPAALAWIDEAATDAAEERQPAPSLSLAGLRLLLVEDSMMIALDAQEMLEAAGARVEVAASVSDALAIIAHGGLDAAVLDVNLSGETSFPIADELATQGVLLVFATGYGESVAIPPRFADTPIATKPYDEAGLRTALAQLLARRG